MFVCVCAYVSAQCRQPCLRARASMSMCVCVHLCGHPCLRARACIVNVCVRVRVCVCLCVCVCMCVCARVCKGQRKFREGSHKV